jgi:naphtho-gamma-pyrone polyketide synthase
MANSCHIYLFGDQTFDYSKDLHDLVHSNNDPVIVSFFEKVYYALRSEIGSLPQTQRQEFGRFSNFAELIALNTSESLHPALDQALCCAYQLASFIK